MELGKVVGMEQAKVGMEKVEMGLEITFRGGEGGDGEGGEGFGNDRFWESEKEIN